MTSGLQSMDYVVQVVQTWGRATEQFGHNNTVIGATALGVAVTVAGTVALQKPENREIAVTTAVPLAVFAGLYKYGPTSGYGPLGNGITGGLITFLALKCWYQKNQINSLKGDVRKNGETLKSIQLTGEDTNRRVIVIEGRLVAMDEKINQINERAERILNFLQQVGHNSQTGYDTSGPALSQTRSLNTSGTFAPSSEPPQVSAGSGSTLTRLLLFTGALGMRINNL